MKKTLLFLAGINFLLSAHSQIIIPVEVIGAAGYTKSVTVNVPDPSKVKGLWLLINNLSYENKASIRFNNGTWIQLNNSTVILPEPEKSYGGIGGAYHIGNMRLTVTVPVNALQSGTNTISFRFNHTDGISAGYRVVRLNLLDAAGNKLLTASSFKEDDPAAWTPPRNNSADIAKGKELWETKPLIASPLNNNILRARCMDCHARDGRDLKYFNYSNESIIERSKFHGLTQLEAEQIASYIRSLNVPNPGRPWNPPYQPGPGLDKKPVNEWSAGAGIDWILDRDEMVYPFVFPNGIDRSTIALDKTLNVRETPVAMQFPDWKHWLPRIHPKDAWGDAFVNSTFNKKYAGEGSGSASFNLRDRLKSNGGFYSSFPGDFDGWGNDRYNFLLPRTEDNFAPAPVKWSRHYAEKVYSTAQWWAVKEWEMVQEFNMEGLGKTIYGAKGEERTWPGIFRHVFEISPHRLHIPRVDTLSFNGKKVNHVYTSNMWYHVQPVISSGNGKMNGFHPVDWQYTHGNLKDLMQESKNTVAEPGRLLILLAKQMQQAHAKNTGPEKPFEGWNFMRDDDISRLIHPDWMPMWKGTDPALKRQIMEALLRNWYEKTATYPPSQYDRSGGDYPISGADHVPVAKMDGDDADRLYYMIPRFRNEGVDCNLMNKICDLGKSLWPKGNWDALKVSCQAIVYPQITITSPVNNTSFASGTFTVTANAFISSGSISKVEFYNGNIKIGEDVSAPYSFQYSNLSPGVYYIVAKAYDQSGTYSAADARVALVTENKGGTTSVNNKYESADDQLIIYPNPSNGNVIISFIMEKDDFVRITLHDVLGREIKSILNEKLMSGKYEYDFSSDEKGILFIRFSSKDSQVSKKLIFLE